MLDMFAPQKKNVKIWNIYKFMWRHVYSITETDKLFCKNSQIYILVQPLIWKYIKMICDMYIAKSDMFYTS